MRFYGFIALTVFFRESENILRFVCGLGIAIKYPSLLFSNQNIGNNSRRSASKKERMGKEIFRLKK